MDWNFQRDDQLLSTVAHGSTGDRKDAFGAFYRRHYRYLFAICYNVATRCRFGFFDYEDLFQDTMTKAYQHAGDFRSDGITDPKDLEDKADAWLGGIARRVAADYLRRNPPCQSVDPVLLETCEELSTESVPDPITEAKLLREAIDTLSETEQAVMWSASQYYQRRDHQRTPSTDLDEIVESLGMSRVNFRKVKERARKKILQYVAQSKTPV